MAKLQVGDRSVEIKENFVDRAVRYFAPVLAQRRLHARVQSAMFNAYAGGYAGASRSDRALQGWPVATGSPDSDILTDLQLLRDRSAWLARNAPIACGAINTTVTNVVGSGLTLQSRIDRKALKLTDEQADAWEDQVEREFRLWSKHCDANRTLTFGGLQELAFRSTLERGDVFISLPYIEKPSVPYGLSLQLIEADRVCNPDSKPDRRELAGGIERDKYGAPIAYHILDTHPGETYSLSASARWVRVSAFGAVTGRRNVLHLFRVLRCGQVRGVPFLAPVIKTLKQLDRYSEAEIMAAVVSGMFTVFVRSNADGQLGPFMPGSEGAGGSDEEVRLGNGAVVGLAPGEDISLADPKRPNANFDPFVLAMVRQIGLCLEIPYEVLVKHFTASYSAARAALLEAWKFFLGRRRWCADYMCQPIYEAWLEEAVANGRIEAPGYLSDPVIREAYCRAEWIGPAKGMINEKDEVQAAVSRLENHMSTLDAETAALTGGDWEANVRQREKEQRTLKAAGLATQMAEGKPTAPAAAPAEPEEGEPQEREVPDQEVEP